MALLAEIATAKVDQVTIRQFQLKNKKQMNRITLAANNNFELQTILIAEMKTYETLQGTASVAGTSVAGAVVAARAKKDNVCDQNTLTRHIFSCLHACLTVSHVTLAQGSARHPIHVSCACVSDLSSTLHFALFTVSLIFYFILLIFIFTVGRFRENSPVRFRE